MNAIGIDVSKGKSTVAVIRPFGEIVKKPFEVAHTSKDLNDLADFILSLEGESRVVLEHTGKYSAPIAESLCNAGIFVSVVNAKLIYNYGNDTIRRDKTDKVDSLKIAAYHFFVQKAEDIYAASAGHFITLSKNDYTKSLIISTVSQLNKLCETVSVIKSKMEKLASELPEYETVIAMHGVGKILAPQLIAEIGDIRNFPKRSSLARFAGIEPPENQSGSYNQYSRRISKQGSPHLRKALFQVMCCVLQLKHTDEPTFQFLDRKRAEGKPYKVYMIAGANKFLRIYYARVKKCMDILGQND